MLFPTCTTFNSEWLVVAILTYTIDVYFSEIHSIGTSAVHRHISGLPVYLFDRLSVAGTSWLLVPDALPIG